MAVRSAIVTIACFDARRVVGRRRGSRGWLSTNVLPERAFASSFALSLAFPCSCALNGVKTRDRRFFLFFDFWGARVLPSNPFIVRVLVGVVLLLGTVKGSLLICCGRRCSFICLSYLMASRMFLKSLFGSLAMMCFFDSILTMLYNMIKITSM